MNNIGGIRNVDNMVHANANVRDNADSSHIVEMKELTNNVIGLSTADIQTIILNTTACNEFADVSNICDCLHTNDHDTTAILHNNTNATYVSQGINPIVEHNNTLTGLSREPKLSYSIVHNAIESQDGITLCEWSYSGNERPEDKFLH